MNKKGLGLRPLVMSIVLVVLFSFFLLSFVTNVITTQNPNSEVLSAKYGLNESIQRMSGSVDQFSAVSENVRGQMGGADPSALDYIFLIFQGAFYIPKAFLDFVFLGINALTNSIFPALSGTGLGTIVSITLTFIISNLLNIPSLTASSVVYSYITEPINELTLIPTKKEEPEKNDESISTETKTEEISILSV